MEFTLSGSDQNPYPTDKDVSLLLKRVLPGAVGPVAEFAQNSPEFAWASNPAEVLRPDGEVVPGLYAVGAAAGFGRGGVHGQRALEGTFLGGCLFSGKVAGESVARK